jgi:hypothetical protein
MQVTTTCDGIQSMRCGSLIAHIISTAATAATAAAATKRKHSRVIVTGGFLGIPTGGSEAGRYDRPVTTNVAECRCGRFRPCTLTLPKVNMDDLQAARNALIKSLQAIDDNNLYL